MGNKQINFDQQYLSTGSIAKLLDVDGVTVRREIKSGRLKSAGRFNSKFIVRVEDYEDWKARYIKPVF